uniref:histidine kinase n=1 Tax=Bionectria ochroleuca TaxID=29856 RepID=A0A8H7K4N6_BIOOC
MVRTQPGAIRRIIMNLFGNALKYTSTGYVLVSLRGQLNADKSKINALIRIEDTGKGMSEEYKRSRLFVPFSQEDSFQPGTGLGLSIVKQIVDSLHGNLEVKSEQYKGTEVDVRLRFTPGPSGDSAPLDETMRAMAKRTRGKQVVLLKESQCLETQGNPPTCQKLTDTLSNTCANWFGLKVAQQGSPDAVNADIFVYCEPPPHEILVRRVQNLLKTSPAEKIPIVIVICPNAEQAVRVKQCQDASLRSLPVIVEVIPQPCGPRKLGRVMSHCLDTADKMAINLPLSPEARLPMFPLPSPPLPAVAPTSPPP